MLSLILAISLFTSPDTILIRGTQNISYRIFTNDSSLCFQCKTNKNWAVPITIDKGNISEYTMTATSGDYIHIVWTKQGRVYYKTNIYPVRNNLQGAEKMNSFKESELSEKISNGASPITQQNTIQWECNIAISEPELTEPASNISINVNGEYLYVTWQAPLEDNPLQIEKWRRARWLEETPFDWETPQNISSSATLPFDIPHSLKNRDPIQMKRVYFLQSGLHSTPDGKVICCDSDHNGLSELIFARIVATYISAWMVYECRPMNHYELVFADTGAYPYPPGITTGNFRPYDVGDIDRDSLTDLVGPNVDKVLNQDIEYNVVTTQESPNYSYSPESLSWWYRYTNNYAVSEPFYFPPDLDGDGRREILFAGPHPTANQTVNYIFENIANNQNILVWAETVGPPPYSYAFGDFDLDGRMEFVSNDLMSIGRVWIFENIGDNQYSLVWMDTVRLPNGSDVFSGNDLDGDGRPEFFVAFANAVSDIFYLYMWETTGNNTYQRTLIDQKSISVNMTTGRRSKCGDIDGDGIDELVWATPTQLFVYKATGNNQFQQVWQWYQDHGTNEALIVNVYDMNKNGYNEIVVGGSGKTSIFEVEAVRVLSPNGGETFHTDSSELIRWQTFHPPRCDSLSIFYSIDYGRTYNLITSGLSGNDTSYLWTVPNVSSDSCKVKIIAYGPGWQYDESDGVFTITSTGITEIATLPLAMTLSVKAFPNPAKQLTAIRYTLPAKTKVLLQLFDISGRLVKTLINEQKNAGNYSLFWNGVDNNNRKMCEGVYFCILKTDEKFLKQKILMVK